jgi:hypothetical protein
VLVSTDGETWTEVCSATSSGETNDLEAYRFDAAPARFVKIVGHGSNRNRWVNITEAKISNAQYVWPPSNEMKRFKTPDDAEDSPPHIYAVTARPSPRPTVPQNTVDGDPATGWSAQDDGQWLTYHLSRTCEVERIRVRWECDHAIPFEVQVSLDGQRWKTVHSGESRGKPGDPETYRLRAASARYIRLLVKGSEPRHWHRLSEVGVGDIAYLPTKEMQWWSRRWESGPPSADTPAPREPMPKMSYAEMAALCIRTLVDTGTDRYGAVRSPIWVLNLDLETMQCFPRYNDALVETAAKSLTYSMLAPYGVGYRAIRSSQRPAGCSNLFVDQPMVRATVLHDQLCVAPAFAPAVNAYVRWCFDHLMDEHSGLLQWGVHTSYDVFDEDLRHDDGDQHEVHSIMPIWPVFSRVDPQMTQAYLARFWREHTNAETGQVDRHATRGRGLDFAGPAGEIILACAYLHTLEPEGPWLGRALQIAHSHWDSRNRDTNLFVNTPHGGTGKRFDNMYSDTTVTGLWASRVLMAGRLTANAELTDMAKRVLLAWATYGWDEETGLPWASLRTDGTPNTKPRNYAGTSYSKFDPSGHWDFWNDYVLGFEAPFATLMTYAVAAQWLDDERLRANAARLAECYRKRLPANGRQGTFAAHYGQLISFFLAMESITGDAGYRRTAEQIADEAVNHLWTGSLFRGFAGRTHYTAVEGAGYLVTALIELDADPEALAALREASPFLWNF